MNRVRLQDFSWVAGLALVVAGTLATSGCHRSAPPGVFIDTASVTRGPLTITVAATGTIEPEAVVQVKSKASGQIIKLPVQMGTQVKPGDLIAQIDPRDPQSRYDQAVAALNAAQANLDVTKTQKIRADSLFAGRALTAPEHETAILAYANAQAQLATAKTNVEVAQIQLADVTIRAPAAGTIIDKEVSEGQVIASATNNVSGGTTLVTLADLGRIVDSTLVTESDIGRVHVGQTATIDVDAYPNRTFHGVVQNVSPQAVTVQSVTMFPVIIALDNSSGLLKPGMNSDVTILAQQRPNALMIPNDAIGTAQDLAQAAVALGVDLSAVQQAGAQRGGAGDMHMTAAGRANGRWGAGRRNARRESRAGFNRQTHELAAASDTDVAEDSLSDEGAEPHPAVVFVLENGKWTPRHVVLGIGNYDQTEVLSGLKEGDRVALVAEIRIQAARDSNLSRIQSRAGLPGMGGGRGGRGGPGRGR